MGLMNGQAHGFFVMVQRRSADAHKGILIGLRDDEMRAVLGLTRNTLNVLVGEPEGFKTNPAQNALG